MFFLLMALLFNSLAVWSQDAVFNLAGKVVTIPRLGSKQPLSQHPRFEGFIQKKFNRPGDFFGPNCYNTSLILSGALSPNDIRYVSPEEFNEVLKTNFIQVNSPEYKDVIVFDAKRSRGHSAFYLGDNLIFHKKSFGTYYHYRVTEIKNAGIVEENEWVPGINDDSSSQMNWPELGTLPLEYYRLKNSNRPKLDPRFDKLIRKLEQLVVLDARSWAFGRKWGMTGEYLLEDFLVYARSLKTDKYTEGVLISLKDQIFIMLEEVYFKSSHSPSRVLEELCIPEHKEQLFDLLRDFGTLLKLDSKKIQIVLEKLSGQDKERCQLRPLQELLK
jgi:hypothetical protein